MIFGVIVVVSATLKFCYNITRVALVSLTNKQIFLFTQDRAAGILWLLRNEMIQFNKKSEPSLRTQHRRKIYYKIRFFFKYVNIFVYLTNIKCFHFSFFIF